MSENIQMLVTFVSKVKAMIGQLLMFFFYL